MQIIQQFIIVETANELKQKKRHKSICQQLKSVKVDDAIYSIVNLGKNKQNSFYFLEVREFKHILSFLPK